MYSRLTPFLTCLAIASPGVAVAQTNISTEVSGINHCMGSDMRCQTLRQENLSVAGKVYFSGGGYSGTPSGVSWRCGTHQTNRYYIEVYINDPGLTWPAACVRTDGSLTLIPGQRYDFRGPSVRGTNAWPGTFYVHSESLQTPTDLRGWTNRYNYLTWQDNSWGEDGLAVERRNSPLYPVPTRSFGIGVAALYYDSGLPSALNGSAQRFCVEAGHQSFASYDIVGPLSGVHTWYNGGTWNISGNNSVFYIRNLVCKGAWSQIGVAGSTEITYTDVTAEVDKTYDYRVRAYRGSNYSGYSNLVNITTVVYVGNE